MVHYSDTRRHTLFATKWRGYLRNSSKKRPECLDGKSTIEPECLDGKSTIEPAAWEKQQGHLKFKHLSEQMRLKT